MDWSFPLRMNSHHKGKKKRRIFIFRRRRIFPLGSFIYGIYILSSSSSILCVPLKLGRGYCLSVPPQLVCWLSKSNQLMKDGPLGDVIISMIQTAAVDARAYRQPQQQQQPTNATRSRKTDDAKRSFWYITRITRDKERKGLHKQK